MTWKKSAMKQGKGGPWSRGAKNAGGRAPRFQRKRKLPSLPMVGHRDQKKKKGKKTNERVPRPRKRRRTKPCTKKK